MPRKHHHHRSSQGSEGELSAATNSMLVDRQVSLASGATSRASMENNKGLEVAQSNMYSWSLLDALVNNQEERAETILMRRSVFSKMFRRKLYREQIEYADRDGTTPLHAACFLDLPHMVAKLVESEVDVDARNYDGVTPLMMAATTGAVECVEILLIEGGANPNLQTAAGLSAVHFAAFKGQVEVIQALSEYSSCNILLPAVDESTAEKMARRSRHHTTTQLLSQLGRRQRRDPALKRGDSGRDTLQMEINQRFGKELGPRHSDPQHEDGHNWRKTVTGYPSSADSMVAPYTTSIRTRGRDRTPKDLGVDELDAYQLQKPKPLRRLGRSPERALRKRNCALCLRRQVERHVRKAAEKEKTCDHRLYCQYCVDGIKEHNLKCYSCRRSLRAARRAVWKDILGVFSFVVPNKDWFGDD